MDKYNIMQHEAPSGWSRQAFGGYHSPTEDFRNPRPGVAQPLTPKPEEEPDKKEEDPSRKKRKKNAYEIIC
jgi:hypothetical protein